MLISMLDGGDFMVIFGIIMMIVGALAFVFPKKFAEIRTFGRRWMSNDPTPTDAAVKMEKIVGIVTFLIGLVMIFL